MFFRTACFTAVLSMLIGSFCALAEQGAKSGDKVTLDVVVSPKDGQPIAGLTEQNFKVFDNNVAQPISSFRALTAPQTAVPVILLVDAINVPYMQLAYERTQIEHFLSANDGRLAQPMSIAIMTDTGTQVQPGFTRDGNALRKAFDSYEIGLRDLRRSGGFYAAQERSQISLEALNRLIVHFGPTPGRKLILFVSPGWPLLSGPEVELTGNQKRQIFEQVVSLSTRLHQARITIDAVNPTGAADDPGRLFYYQQFVKPVKKPSQTDLGDLGLQVLAAQSGGLVLNASNDVSGLLQRAMGETLASYEITYAAPPSEGPNELHEVGVKVDKPSLTVHSINGYYAQPMVTGTSVATPSVVPVGK